MTTTNYVELARLRFIQILATCEESEICEETPAPDAGTRCDCHIPGVVWDELPKDDHEMTEEEIEDAASHF